MEAGCATGEHRFAEYPEEDAKKYFYDRPIKHGGNDFETHGRFSGYFRKPAAYVPMSQGGRRAQETLSADEQKKLDSKDRYCLNWACLRVFQQKDNHKKACRSHPGKWDFGYSAQRVTSAGSDDTLWEPHWTCCRGEWESKGCKRRFHRGPFLEEYKQAPRLYEWPDQRV